MGWLVSFDRAQPLLDLEIAFRTAAIIFFFSPSHSKKWREGEEGWGGGGKSLFFQRTFFSVCG